MSEISRYDIVQEVKRRAIAAIFRADAVFTKHGRDDPARTAACDQLTAEVRELWNVIRPADPGWHARLHEAWERLIVASIEFDVVVVGFCNAGGEVAPEDPDDVGDEK